MAGLVLHNDLRAFKLAEAEAASRSNGTKTVVVPGGDPELISSHGTRSGLGHGWRERLLFRRCWIGSQAVFHRKRNWKLNRGS
jgi:hypothetical protein